MLFLMEQEEIYILTLVPMELKKVFLSRQRES